jgi:hypothetical protein
MTEPPGLESMTMKIGSSRFLLFQYWMRLVT